MTNSTMGWFSRLRNGLDNAAPSFLSRHFTWLSATLLGIFVALTLFLVLVYVPGVTANKVLNILLTAGAWIATGLTALGALITINEKWGFLGFNEEESTGESKDRGLSSPARGFVRTDEEILEEALILLEDWFSVTERGEVSLHPQEDSIVLDRRGMLYVFAIFTAYQAYPDEVGSPEVTKQELMDELGFSTASADVFMSKMSNYLKRNFDRGDAEALRDMEDDEMAVKLNVSQSYQAARYIIGERRAPN